jgi:N-acetylated-alpha-linked acidic dipeptidase
MDIKKMLFCLLLSFFSKIFFGQKLLGFDEVNFPREKDIEKQFDAQLNSRDLDSWLKFLSSHPHHVGSPQDKINAEFIASLFKQWGYETEIKNYYVLFPTPKTRILELIGAKPYKSKLEEPAIPEDHTSGQKSEQLPTYNAYSADGDVTADLVFVNRGIPSDYEELEKMGVDVKGKIVIAKYGGSWRGIKPKLAAAHGAIGCIIYSDPADDGYAQGDTYPSGPFRNKAGAQRGSVMDMPVYPGDPLTPDIAATKEAKRLDRKDAKTIMKIPVLPISYEDALPFLESLNGQVVPPSWRGALPITYHTGPGTEKVHLKLEFNWDIKPLYDVIAKLPGSEFPDEWVIRGNHHDAWVNGASDPLSGLISELEEAKSIGELAKKGIKFKRTLIFCAWDGEEPALLGSTEWVEDHQEELRQKAVAYINSDVNGRGFIGASGSHTLEPFFNQVIEDVTDPQTGVSIKERRYARSIVDADLNTRAKMINNKYLKLSALGAGSDYSPFIQHLGVPSMDIGFGGENAGGDYHSVYDSYDAFIRFKDPGFQYGIALCKTTGRIILRLANADILPFDFNAFYKTVADYESEVKSLLDNERNETDIENKMIKDNLFNLSRDPKKVYMQPPTKDPVPYLNFSDLDNMLVKLKVTTEEFQKLINNSNKVSSGQLKQLNELLYKAEGKLIYLNGLPRRPWYKHEIYAPGLYTGYGVKTLPGIREAIEQRNWKEAQENILIVTNVLDTYNNQVKQAANLLNKASF